MKLTCSRDELVATLAIVVARRLDPDTVQVLAGILLAAEDGQLELAATDMELSLRSSLDARSTARARVVVPGRLLVDIARLLPGGEVVARAPRRGRRRSSSRAGRRATGCTRTQRRGLPAAARGRPAAAALDRRRRAARAPSARVGRAASRDESRPVLTGVLVRFEGGKLVMAATDSYRLSVQGDVARGRRARPRGDRAGTGARRALAHRAGRRRARARRAREPGRVRRRRRAG